MIEKQKTLSEQLLEIPAGKSEHISYLQFKPHSVRQVASNLNKLGHEFKVTEKGCPDGCIVKRIK